MRYIFLIEQFLTFQINAAGTSVDLGAILSQFGFDVTKADGCEQWLLHQSQETLTNVIQKAVSCQQNSQCISGVVSQVKTVVPMLQNMAEQCPSYKNDLEIIFTFLNGILKKDDVAIVSSFFSLAQGKLPM